MSDRLFESQLNVTKITGRRHRTPSGLMFWRCFCSKYDIFWSQRSHRKRQNVAVDNADWNIFVKKRVSKCSIDFLILGNGEVFHCEFTDSSLVAWRLCHTSDRCFPRRCFCLFDILLMYFNSVLHRVHTCHCFLVASSTVLFPYSRCYGLYFNLKFAGRLEAVLKGFW